MASFDFSDAQQDYDDSAPSRIDSTIDALYAFWTDAETTLEQKAHEAFYPLSDTDGLDEEARLALEQRERLASEASRASKAEELRLAYETYHTESLSAIYLEANDYGLLRIQHVDPTNRNEHRPQEVIDAIEALNAENGRRRNKISSIMDVAFHGYLLLYSQLRYAAVCDGEPLLASDNSLLSMRYASFNHVEMKNNSPFQNSLIYLLDLLYTRQWRRYAESCYSQVTIRGHGTHAWVKECEISEFVFSAVTKESNFAMWQILTSSPSNMENCVRILLKIKDSQFPELKKDRGVFAFSNGLYIAYKDKFYEYPIPPGAVSPSVVACNFIDHPFTHYSTQPHYDDWYNFPTPHLQQILNYQGLEEEVCRWLYIFLGRLLYELNTFDCWQVIPFLKGAAGSGKSTILNSVAAKFYDAADVGIMQNNIEHKFGLSQVMDRLLFIAPEVKRDFELNQAEFQTIVSGERMAPAVKGKTAEAITWSVPGILAGNELPGWNDNSGSLSRRMIVFHFGRKVIDSDPLLPQKLELELPALLHKCNYAYLAAVSNFGSKSIWNTLPDYFKETQRELGESCNALRSFLASDQVSVDPHKYVPQNVFIKALKEYCVANNYPSFARWERDYFMAIFDDMGLSVEKTDLPYPPESTDTRVRAFIKGVDVVMQ